MATVVGADEHSHTNIAIDPVQQLLLRRDLDTSIQRLGDLLHENFLVGLLTSLSGDLSQSISPVTLISNHVHFDRALSITLQSLGSQAFQVQVPLVRQLPSASRRASPSALE